MSEPKKPYAYIAFTGDTWNGSSAPEIAADWMVELVADGCTIKPVYSREEYDAEMARLK
jgi:hypothetical protein